MRLPLLLVPFASCVFANSAATQSNRYIHVGEDLIDGSPAYVDVTTINQVNGTEHTYVIVYAPGPDRSEEYAKVNCNNPSSIFLQKAIYYSQNAVTKSTAINYQQPAQDLYYRANQAVCGRR